VCGCVGGEGGGVSYTVDIEKLYRTELLWSADTEDTTWLDLASQGRGGGDLFKCPLGEQVAFDA
jgi:hypothetical protein